jgi:hypothetical protein
VIERREVCKRRRRKERKRRRINIKRVDTQLVVVGKYPTVYFAIDDIANC